MTIRRLVPDDASAYRALMLAAYADHPDAFLSSFEERAAQPADWWAWRLAAGEQATQRVFGAFDDGRLVGAAGWQRESRGKAAHRAELFGMVVSAQARGRGTGRAIVEAILADMGATPGVLTVRLTVTVGNAGAERLYARCGFERIGVEPMAMRIGDTFLAKATMWRRLARGGSSGPDSRREAGEPGGPG